jgi:hypothetical protein
MTFVAHEEWDDESHLSRFWIIAMDEDHRSAGPFARIVKRKPEPPLWRFDDARLFEDTASQMQVLRRLQITCSLRSRIEEIV